MHKQIFLLLLLATNCFSQYEGNTNGLVRDPTFHRNSLNSYQKELLVTPQKQTKFDENGNCLIACIASIIDEPIDSVVNLYEYLNWKYVVYEYLKTKGYTFIAVLSIDEYKHWKDFTGIEGYAIVVGMSPRSKDRMHAVIYKNGKPFFDPHPDGSFLLDEREIYLIVKD